MQHWRRFKWCDVFKFTLLQHSPVGFFFQVFPYLRKLFSRILQWCCAVKLQQCVDMFNTVPDAILEDNEEIVILNLSWIQQPQPKLLSDMLGLNFYKLSDYFVLIFKCWWLAGFTLHFSDLFVWCHVAYRKIIRQYLRCWPLHKKVWS